jgi:serine/threonine protein kinase
MLFRWADGNLRDFWRNDPSPERTPERVRWMLDQLHGIADGLRAIHGNIPEDELSPNDKNTGRHGDIKPENILWMKYHDGGENHLLISDFGLSRFHRYKSMSEKQVPGFSPSYRPPECDLPGVTISVKYDIWTLGCLVLDFLTWYLLGFDAVDAKFTDARVEDEMLEQTGRQHIPEDKFFMLYYEGNNQGAKLKPSVVNVSNTHPALGPSRLRRDPWGTFADNTHVKVDGEVTQAPLLSRIRP